MQNKIIEKLIALSEPSYAEFNRKLCSDTKKDILGIRLPKLRALAKEIIKTSDYLRVFGKSIACK